MKYLLYELEGGYGVVGPGQRQQFLQMITAGAGLLHISEIEEEVKAGVTITITIVSDRGGGRGFGDQNRGSCSTTSTTIQAYEWWDWI